MTQLGETWRTVRDSVDCGASNPASSRNKGFASAISREMAILPKPGNAFRHQNQSQFQDLIRASLSPGVFGGECGEGVGGAVAFALQVQCLSAQSRLTA